ncbi:hypothetical protein VTO73DRAFT_12141 [Trametes versicolor]
MPRFLNTWTGEFEWHPDPKMVTYAILSHVWRKPEEGGEQSYDDVRRIQQEVEENRWVPASLDSDTGVCSDTSMAWAPFAFISFEDIESTEYGTIFAHPGLSDKIKGFCQVAREAGFRLAWNDACCIDKTSSAELSEAINSMYEWYRHSDMCYVYLADVSKGDVPQEICEEFWWSKWHKRGWTLQELIAPEHIIFLTETWNVLGTKMSLAKTLERITGVDFDILVGRATLNSVSVARRMSWAAKRQTTRVEDRAYSLLGIFGLHMSPIYVEGEHAFLRLEEEIIRTIPDQSIFARGDICSLKISLNDKCLEIRELMKVLKHVRPTVEDVTLLRHYLGPSLPKSLQHSGPFPHTVFDHFSFFSYIKDAVFKISPHSMDTLRTLRIDPSPLQVTHSEQEISLETTLAFHHDSGAGPTDVIALRLSIKKCLYDMKAEACFSVGRVGAVGSGSGQSSIGAAAGASHHAVVNTPHISGGFLDLDHPNDSRTVISFGVWDMDRRTLVHMEYIVQSKETWGNRARLLRIALQHTFASLPDEDDLPRSNLWTGTDVCESDSETSNEHENVFPSCESTSIPVSADREAVCASRDNVEALRQENDAQTVQTTPAAYHAANPLYSTSAPSLIQIPPCGSPEWDASSGTSWSSERPARSEPTRPSNGWEHRDHDPESFGDAGAQHETEDGCEGFPGRHEDVGLRAEIEQLKRKNAELSSELAAVSSQLATVFARLDALTTSPAVNAV